MQRARAKKKISERGKETRTPGVASASEQFVFHHRKETALHKRGDIQERNPVTGRAAARLEKIKKRSTSMTIAGHRRGRRKCALPSFPGYFDPRKQCKNKWPLRADADDILLADVSCAGIAIAAVLSV